MRVTNWVLTLVRAEKAEHVAAQRHPDAAAAAKKRDHEHDDQTHAADDRTVVDDGAPLDRELTRTTTRTFGPDEDLPRMRRFRIWGRKWSMLAYALFLLLCNLAAPCVLYYPLKNFTSLSEHALLGIASATLGISSSFDNPFRLWKLWKRPELYGALNKPTFERQPGLKNKLAYYLQVSDFSQHLYSYALFPVFAIPLAISSSVNPPMHDFFLMSTPMLVAVPGIFFLYSLFDVKCPCWMSSDAPGQKMKPGVFYLFEDIGAVDFRHGKEFRRVLHERYSVSPIYRDHMWYQTLWWTWGCAVYFSMIAGIAWTIDFDIAFGLVLGLLFAWMATWAVLSVLIAKKFHHRENLWLEARRRDPEVAMAMTREGQVQAADEERRIRRESSRRLSSRHTERGGDPEKVHAREELREEKAKRLQHEMDSPNRPVTSESAIED